MTDHRPTVSIIIPAYNEASVIEQCVRACLAQTFPAHEIIVVDNKSTDDTAAIVARLQAELPTAPIHLLSQDVEQGLVPTRNFGFEHATGEVLGRIDADSLVRPNWVDAVQRAFTNEQVAAATGPVYYYDMPFQKLAERGDAVTRKAVSRAVRRKKLLFGSNMAIRATEWPFLKLVHCRDKADRFHEDVDLSVHLHAANKTIAYTDDMVVGMSARRLDDSPRDFTDYVMRFERTYRAHGVKSITMRTPMAIFLGIYPFGKAVRLTQKLSA